jgi:hypothetical protein
LLKQHVKAFGPTKWTQLVAFLPGRTAAAVAWHWKKMDGLQGEPLCASSALLGDRSLALVARLPWSAEENELLQKAYQQHNALKPDGPAFWAAVSNAIPGRSAKATKTNFERQLGEKDETLNAHGQPRKRSLNGVHKELAFEKKYANKRIRNMWPRLTNSQHNVVGNRSGLRSPGTKN